MFSPWRSGSFPWAQPPLPNAACCGHYSIHDDDDDDDDDDDGQFDDNVVDYNADDYDYNDGSTPST